MRWGEVVESRSEGGVVESWNERRGVVESWSEGGGVVESLSERGGLVESRSEGGEAEESDCWSVSKESELVLLLHRPQSLGGLLWDIRFKWKVIKVVYVSESEWTLCEWWVWDTGWGEISFSMKGGIQVLMRTRGNQTLHFTGFPKQMKTERIKGLTLRYWQGSDE